MPSLDIYAAIITHKYAVPNRCVFFSPSATILSDCSRLDYQFYGTPSLGQLLVNFVVETWRYLPNYRMRVPIHILTLRVVKTIQNGFFIKY